MTPAELFLGGRYQELADQIDSRAFDSQTSRILTVFNPMPLSFSGIAGFFVSMKWPDTNAVPTIRITDLIDRQATPLRIDDYIQGDGCVACTLVFGVMDVPACGFKSYLAEYATPGPMLRAGAPSRECAVVETVPHAASLPLSLSFG